MLHCGHQKRDSLSLSTGQQTNLGSQTIFQSQVQCCKQFTISFPFFLSDSKTKGSWLSSSCCQCHIFFNLHVCCGSGHRVLEHTSEIFGSFVLRKIGNILSIYQNLSFIYVINTAQHVKKCRFSCSVSTNDSHKISIIQGPVNSS